MNRRSRGFTLLELGIVLGSIAILATVVLIGRGMIEGARISSCVSLIDDLRKASRSYALRANGGASFNGISLGNMQGAPFNLLPNPFLSPWGAQPEVVPFGPAPAVEIRIGVCTPLATTAIDLQSALTSGPGPTVALAATLPSGVACPCGTCAVLVRTQ